MLDRGSWHVVFVEVEVSLGYELVDGNVGDTWSGHERGWKSPRRSLYAELHTASISIPYLSANLNTI